ncbi:LexA family transcriptional regulator [Siphonobacter sp. SORGH_AS_0500]|uniref:XRE family transcriptional regulator n=1 Tax=Siphonobacter sp. SORGH_AS_0500 TaxID=1864824 RepID=UPI00285C5C86|nr:LexA family transcriptional regulator [Siphonobacter sp. SORGH_AS_0500]MDR6195207.1 transcriptional regulator with XRE-family HTH domain [Siphonobacter sp. SORGH_AS_0500]
MDKFGKRLKEARSKLGFSQEELAKLVGKSNKQIVSNWENNKHSPSIPELKKIAEVLNTTISFLTEGAEIQTIPNGPLISYWGNVDVTGGKVQLENNSDNKPTGFIQIPGFEDCQHAVNHYGDSMSPYINGGDVILLKLVDNWRDYILFGEVFLVITDTMRTVKYVKKSANPNNFLLVPHNDFYEAFELPKAEILQMYLVKGTVQRKLL